MLAIGFIPRLAREQLAALTAGQPIPPPPGGWTHGDRVALAGVLLSGPMGETPSAKPLGLTSFDGHPPELLQVAQERLWYELCSVLQTIIRDTIALDPSADKGKLRWTESPLRLPGKKPPRRPK